MGVGFILVLLGAYAPAAIAVQVGTVTSSLADVHQTADPNSPVIEQLSSGARVYSSDGKSQGFYKIKTPDGKVGFVSDSQIKVTPLPPKSEAKGLQPRAHRKSQTEADDSSESENRPVTGFRVFGGLSMFDLANYNTIFAVTAFSNGVSYGGEFFYGLSKGVRLLMHVERISKDVSVNFSGPPTVTIQTLVASTPVMAGAEFRLAHASDDFELTLDTLGGMGFGTSATSTTNILGSTGTIVYSGTPLAIMAKLNAELLLGSTLRLAAYAGYRLQNLAASPPKSNNSTILGEVFNQSGSGASSPSNEGINLSGPVVGLSVGLAF